jgi:protein-tyrosine kinase
MMTRIDDALRRARAGAGRRVPAGAFRPEDLPADPAAGVPTRADAFIAPWDFGEAASDRELLRSPAPAASQAPARHVRDPLAALDLGQLAVFTRFNRQVAEKLVVTSGVPATCIEQFRKLAGTLHHAQLDRNIKVVMITSAIAGEGKTLTATNLALTLSESYKRNVLLVDADLRRPSLHELFEIPNDSGLGEGLKAETERLLPIVKISPQLSLLTAGRPDPDPMSGLTSPRMRRIIEEATARFEWVVIDTPPVGLLPDANLLAEMVDGTILVVEAGQTPYTLVQRAVEGIGRERILGVVLNQVEETRTFGGYKYYHYYSRYGRKSS